MSQPPRISEEVFFNNVEREVWDKLDDRPQQEVSKVAAEAAADSLSLIEHCESPIEQVLLIWVNYMNTVVPFVRKSSDLVINPQETIQTPNGSYRVAFLLCGQFEVYVPDLGDITVEVALAVECDGHDFHEKTKDQASHDKKRDRGLKAAGYEVVRFTGSEIWANPQNCAQEIRDLFQGIARRKLKDLSQARRG